MLSVSWSYTATVTTSLPSVTSNSKPCIHVGSSVFLIVLVLPLIPLARDTTAKGSLNPLLSAASRPSAPRTATRSRLGSPCGALASSAAASAAAPAALEAVAREP